MTVRMLPGPSALTEFEAARLAARLRAIDAGVVSVEASYLYLLLLHNNSEKEINNQRLAELLGAGVECANGPRVWIGPRVGTQSPWSSKATDILHNTGFGAIERIERARVVRIASSSASDLKALAVALHDRMTESVFFESADELIGKPAGVENLHHFQDGIPQVRTLVVTGNHQTEVEFLGKRHDGLRALCCRAPPTWQTPCLPSSARAA